MKLNPPLRASLKKGLLSAFTERDALASQVLFALNKNLDEIVSADKNLDVTAEKLIEWSRSTEVLLPLFKELGANSQNSELQEAVRLLNSEHPVQLQVSPVSARRIDQGFEVLLSLMSIQEVRVAVMGFRHDFEEVTRQLRVIRAYKDLHDGLHEIQIRCYDQLVNEIGCFPESESARDNVYQYIVCLQTVYHDLLEVSSRNELRSEETIWITQFLEPAMANLETALTALDGRQLKGATNALGHILAIRPAMINSWLYKSASELRLGRLVVELRRMLNQNVSIPDDENIRLLNSGVEQLSRLEMRLNDLIAGHNQWQQVDDELRLIAASLRGNLDDLRLSWPMFKRTAEPLYRESEEPELRFLRNLAKKLDDALEHGTRSSITEQFRRFKTQAKAKFYRVDLTLKKQCDELPVIAEPLDRLLQRFQ